MPPRSTDGRLYCDGGYQATWDGTEPISTTIAQAIADITDTPVRELPPLGRTIDTDALDDLLRSRPGSPVPPDVRISFTYQRYRVIFDDSGIIRIQLSDNSDVK